MRQKPSLLYCLIGLILTGVIGCSNDGDGTARIEVWLTDSPGDYQEVNIDVQEVRVHVGNEESESGWQSLDFTQSGVYNILDLTNGLDTLLGSVELPAGKISQVRLVLGENNSLKVDDEIFELKTPSAQQSGLKLQVHQTLKEGILYKVLLDFDAARSIVQTGNGKYILKPVIRTITEAQGGTIKGVVSPPESTPAIYAIRNSDTVATVFSNDAGAFLIRGLDAGTYQVSFQPNELYTPYSIRDVNVSTGVVTDLDTVMLAD